MRDMHWRQHLATGWVLMVASALVTRAEDWPGCADPRTKASPVRRMCRCSGVRPTTWSGRPPFPAHSWSSPIVSGDRVFVTTATDGGVQCHVLCLNRIDGKMVWDKQVFEQAAGHKSPRNTYATPTPCTDGKCVYAVFGDGSFVALDYDGNVVWTDRQFKFYSEHGLGTSPILHGGLLIMARDGSSEGSDKKLGWQEPWDQAFVVALDAKTGQVRWQQRRGLSRISHGVPTIWSAPDGRIQLISEAGDVVQGFDVQTGERLWSSQVIGEGKVPSAVVGADLVFTAGGWGGQESIKAFKLGGTGELQESNLVWQQRKGMPKVPSMLYVEPYLFAITDGGIASCLQAATGQIVWQQRIGGNYSASPVFAAGRIYFLSDEGNTTVIQAGPEFKVLAENPLGEQVQASMAIAHSQLFIRSATQLYCIGGR